MRYTRPREHLLNCVFIIVQVRQKCNSLFFNSQLNIGIAGDIMVQFSWETGANPVRGRRRDAFIRLVGFTEQNISL